MISAVAARKAALTAQASGSSRLPIEESSSSSPPISSNDPEQTRKLKLSRKTRDESKIARKLKPYERPDWRKEQGKAETKGVKGDSVGTEEGVDGLSVSEDDIDNTLAQSNEPSSTSGLLVVESSDDEDGGGAGPQLQLDVSTIFPQLSTFFGPVHIRTPEESILSTFQPNPDKNMFFLSNSECSTLSLSFPATLVCLQDEDALCLLGSCGLTLLTGTLDLCGTTLEASNRSYRIFSPRCSPLPIIRTRSSHSSSSTLQGELIPDRLRGVLHFKAILALQGLATGVEGLGQICHPFETMFDPPKWQKDKVSSPFKIPGLHMVFSSTKELGPFTLPSTWSNALDSISIESNKSCMNSPPGVYIVKGPKNSGKSTFARTLTNRLLGVYHRVAFLECDIGQTEFTPSGMVSLNIISEPLFGPPFTHPTLPNFAHFIGASTPRSSPSHYLDAISALIETYRHEVQTPLLTMSDDEHTDSSKISDRIPLIVNTMGWVKGLGADLNYKIESMCEPTSIFNIQAPSQEAHQNAGPSFGPKYVGIHNSYSAFCSDVIMDAPATQIHVLDPAPSITTVGLTAADYRTISLLSYFHALFPKHSYPSDLDQITAYRWDTSRPLCAVPPIEVDSSLAFDGVVLTGAGSEDVVEDEIGRVLNGAIVGLVRCDPGTINEHNTSKSLKAFGIPYTRGCDPPSPVSSRCVGLALIRGVSSPIPVSESDPSTTPPMTTFLHLLTPTPYAFLRQARVLVKGEVELPIWGMLDFRSFFKEEKEIGEVAGVEPENVPYLQWGKAPVGAFGAEKRRVRRNLMRRGQI